MKNYFLKFLCIVIGVGAIGSLVFAEKEKKPGVSLKWSGFCTPVEVTCKNRERVLGRAEPRLRKGSFCSPCYFTPPAAWPMNMGRKEWAEKVCLDKGGMLDIKQPTYHVDIQQLLQDALMISLSVSEKQLIGLVQGIAASTWDKQKKYDAYVQAVYGGYGLPTLNLEKASTKQEKVIADVQQKAPLAPSTEKCTAVMTDPDQASATCPVQPVTCPMVPLAPPPPPLPGTLGEKANKELNKLDVPMPSQSVIQQIQKDNKLESREQLGLDSRTDLLNQIKEGKKLKPTPKTGEDKKRVEPPAGDLGSVLSQALEKRRKVIAPKPEKPVGYGSLQEEEQNWED